MDKKYLYGYYELSEAARIDEMCKWVLWGNEEGGHSFIIDNKVDKELYYDLRDELVNFFNHWNFVLDSDVKYILKLEVLEGVIYLSMEYLDIYGKFNKELVEVIPLNEIELIIYVFYYNQDGPHDEYGHYIPNS